ncbi:hypothetical protein [Burkholderia ambifaria]|jgi:hypothetical protein|nr:hypothetical protein [Burkholderia ambifaria]
MENKGAEQGVDLMGHFVKLFGMKNEILTCNLIPGLPFLGGRS